MALTVVPDTSTPTTILAVDLSKQIIQLHGAQSLITSEPLMWLRFARHLRNPTKYYHITAACLLSPSCTRQIQSMSSHPASLRCISISHLHLGVRSGPVPSSSRQFCSSHPLHAAFPTNLAPSVTWFKMSVHTRHGNFIGIPFC
jgi:hypothetical protein